MVQTSVKSHICLSWRARLSTRLNSDAQELFSYTRSNAAWQTHAGKLSEMKEHANKASRIVQDLNNMKGVGSPWQQTAIERITPTLNELATNLQATIEHLNKNQAQVHMPAYKDYASANAELAEDLSQTVSDFVNYAQTKANLETLTRKLEVPSTQ